jgi:hypothetical protein
LSLPIAVAVAAVKAVERYLFSEYIEGSACYNKCLEIYNPTGASIDLAAGGYAMRVIL